MNDTISKRDVKWQIQEWINELTEAMDMLDSIPSADTPTKTGTWSKEITGNGWNEWLKVTCSECGRTYNDLYPDNFCPSCGARMRGDEE